MTLYLIFYNPDSMDMGGTDYHNIKTPFTFIYAEEPEDLKSHISYNSFGPLIKDIAPNKFKFLQEAFPIAGGLDRELFSHLTINQNSNIYGCAYLDNNC